MTGDPNKFIALKYKDWDTGSSENSSELKVIGTGDIKLNLNFIIWKVLLIKNMRFNWLTINQLRGSGYVIEFYYSKYLVKHNDFITLTGQRINLLCITNIFLKCLKPKEDEAWLWYKRLGLTNMRTISKICKGLVKGLLNIRFIKDQLCDAC